MQGEGIATAGGSLPPSVVPPSLVVLPPCRGTCPRSPSSLGACHRRQWLPMSSRTRLHRWWFPFVASGPSSSSGLPLAGGSPSSLVVALRLLAQLVPSSSVLQVVGPLTSPVPACALPGGVCCRCFPAFPANRCGCSTSAGAPPVVA